MQGPTENRQGEWAPWINTIIIISFKDKWDVRNQYFCISFLYRLDWVHGLVWDGNYRVTRNKLRTYWSILTRKNPSRKSLVKLRISSHKLRIETGRYDKVPRGERLGSLCNCNKIEDETCFLLGCILLGLFWLFLFRFRNNRIRRISISKRTLLLKTEYPWQRIWQRWPENHYFSAHARAAA